MLRKAATSIVGFVSLALALVPLHTVVLVQNAREGLRNRRPEPGRPS